MTSYRLTSLSVHGRATLATFPTQRDALAYVRSIADIVEEDSDNPGYFDLFTRGGEVLALEPVGTATLTPYKVPYDRPGDGPEGIEDLAREIGWERAYAHHNID